MSEKYAECPGVCVRTDIEPPEQETTFVHLHEFEETLSGQTYIYVYNEEGLVDNLQSKLDELRENNEFATGVVFPQWLEEEMDGLSTNVIQSVVWMKAFDEDGLTKDDLDVLKEYYD